MRSGLRDGRQGPTSAQDRVHRLRHSWEAMMQGYLPGRAELLTVGLGAAEDSLGRPPASVLDIGGGPGTTAEAVLRRWPRAAVTVLDADPALLALAEVALPQVAARHGDLRTSAWRTAAEGPHDLVLLVMTLHYLPERRAAQLYAEIRELLRPGGTLLVVDAIATGRKPRQSGPELHATWLRWWQELHGDPAAERVADRRIAAYSGMASAEFIASIRWHEDAARAAGFATCRPVRRRGQYAALVAGAPT